MRMLILDEPSRWPARTITAFAFNGIDAFCQPAPDTAEHLDVIAAIPSRLEELSHESGLPVPVLAILPDPHPAAVVNALTSGACGILVWPPRDIQVLSRFIATIVSAHEDSVDDLDTIRALQIARLIADTTAGEALEPMCDTVVRTLAAALDCDGIALYLTAGHDAGWKCTAQYGLPLETDTDDPGFCSAWRDHGTGSGDPIVIANRCNLRNSLPARLADTASILAAPLDSTRGIIGVLFIARNRHSVFSPAFRTLISVIARQMAVGIEKARLQRRHVRSERRALFLNELDELLHSAYDERRIVDRLARKTTEWLGSGCAVFLRQPGTHVLEAVMSYHHNTACQEFLEIELAQKPVEVGEGIIGQVARDGQTIVARADELTKWYPNRQYLLRAGISATLAVSLRARGEIIGVLSCSRSEPDALYSTADIILAEEIADRAAAALSHARLLRETRDRNAELEALFNLTTRVTQAVAAMVQRSEDISVVLDAVLRGVEGLLHTSCTCLVEASSDGTELELPACRGDEKARLADAASTVIQAWGTGIQRSGDPLIIADMQTSKSIHVAAAAVRYGYRTLYAAPLEREGSRMRFLLAISKDAHVLPHQKAQLLKTVAAFAGMAISNGSSYQRERRIAQRLQTAMLPPITDRIGMVQVANAYHSALEEANVGGDFYDLIDFGDDRYGIVIGDVSGKGLAAAVHTAMVKYTLQAYALYQDSPAVVLQRVNNALCRLLPDDVFVTVFYMVLNGRTCEAVWANAGQEGPLVHHPSGEIETLESTGRALGVFHGAEYREHILALNGGDAVLLYTDGLSEARRRGLFLDPGGVAEMLKTHARGTAREIVDRIYADVKTYCAGEMLDDVTMIALKVPDDRRLSA